MAIGENIEAWMVQPHFSKGDLHRIGCEPNVVVLILGVGGTQWISACPFFGNSIF
jgi:hypothetical protein